MPKYNPEVLEDRIKLRDAILSKLQQSGFVTEQSFDYSGELVFSRRVNGSNLFVMVYTSIANGEVRVKGSDAIRVAGVYKAGNIRRGIVSETRVNRVGEIDDIVNRMYQRMRECYRSCNQNKCCSQCGSPTFVSKTGRNTCARVCWTELY